MGKAPETVSKSPDFTGNYIDKRDLETQLEQLGYRTLSIDGIREKPKITPDITWLCSVNDTSTPATQVGTLYYDYKSHKFNIYLNGG